MEFKWRASGRQNLAVGLVKFHKGEKGRPTDIQSYTSYKYCSKLGVFITKMIYKHKFQGQWISNWRFKFFGKPGGKKNLLNVAWGNMPGHIQSSTQNKLNMITTMSLQNNNSRFNLFRIASCDSCVLPWRTTKKIFRVSQQRTENSIFRVNFRIGFYVITTMILQISNSRFNLFRIESFESWVCFLGEPRKKICWLSQQGTEKSIFRVIFRIGFDVINAMILQNTISRFNFFRIASFDSWVC